MSCHSLCRAAIHFLRASLRGRRVAPSCALAGLLSLLAVPHPAWAQLPSPRLHWVYPPGGQRGASVEVTVQGIDLDPEVTADPAASTSQLVFSHPGISAQPKTSPPRPFETEPQPIPGQFVVTIADDVPPGIHEARVRGRYGLSTPRPFSVGELPEVVEQGSNNTLDTALPVELNSVVNGRAGGDSYDAYQFSATTGQRVLLRCEALRIDSQMDATLVLLDDAGRQLAYSRDVRHSEPLIDFTIPADGVYRVQVYDFTYRGGEPFYYRLSVSLQPHIDFVLPPSATAGATSKFTLYGRNLPGGTPAGGVAVDGVALEQLEVEIPVPAEPAELGVPLSGSFVAPLHASARGFEYRLQTPAGSSNPVFISFAQAAVVTEQEPNDNRDQPQPITTPCELVGQFHPRRDRDWFAFQAKQGETFAIEVFSQRLGLPTDPFLLVQHVATNEAGETTVRDIIEADDVDPAFANPPFDAPLRDSALVFTADADGTYRVLLQDLYAGSDPDPRHVYRLSVGPPKPDFDLVATFKSADPDPNKALAAAPSLRPGGTERTVVQAYRRAGFTEAITVAAHDLPAGVVCRPVVIPAGQNRATLVFAAAEDASPSTSTVRIVGTASAGDQQIPRPALGSGVVWDKAGPNELTHARLTRHIQLSVIADPQPLSVALGEAPIVDATRGGKISLPVQVTRREGAKGPLTLEASGLPPQIKAAPLTVDEQTAQAALELTVEPDAPLGSWSFHLAGTTKAAYQRNPEAARQAEAEKNRFAELIAQLTQASQAAEEAKAAAEAKVAELSAAAESPEIVEQRQTAEQTRQQAIAAATSAVEKLQAAQQAQAAVDKRATDLAAAAAPKDIDVFVHSLPVMLQVAEAAPVAPAAPPATP